MNKNYPIPAKVNILIIVICTALYFFLLIAGSKTHSIGNKILLGLAFGIIMIPVYSLIHESAHFSLNPSSKWNLYLGRWLCCLFIVSFTFFRHCHLKHHSKNRTDEEMWDLYYEHQNKWLRYGNLYLMMIGLGYLSMWLSVVIFAIHPPLINSRVFKKHTEMRGFLKGIEKGSKFKTFQGESLIVISFQIAVLWLLNWDFTTWLMFYLIHGLIWSSQNYVNHAFSPRDVLNGAHNLKIPVWLNIIYLNFNIHLAHHQNPAIPWLYLPKFIKSGAGRFSFFKNYIRLWKGPRLTNESEPKLFFK